MGHKRTIIKFKILISLLLVASLLLFALPVQAALVEPTYSPGPGGDALCSGDFYFRIDDNAEINGETGNGLDDLGPGTYTATNGTIEVEFTLYAAPNGGSISAVDWELLTPGYKIMVVGVQDGVDGGLIYDYGPLGGVTSDTGLTTPGPDQCASCTCKNISHIDFCYTEDENGNGGTPGEIVGGEIYPAGKLGLLAPWLLLALALGAAGIVLARRRSTE